MLNREDFDFYYLIICSRGPGLLRAASKPAKNGGDTIGHVMINANPCAIADL
ncbi:MAG: hypothetical protein ABSF90_00625 [Syntrophobacteraceae bacterium]|jgi:hypothetical protein